jgi:RNA polymerase sigma factor (sigma-70 family)
VADASYGRTDDVRLVIAIARDDADAFAEAYRRHAGAVFGLAHRLRWERALAEEMVQDVFLRLWEHPERFDQPRGSLRSFLLMDAHARCVDRIRSDSRRREREERSVRAELVSHYDLDLEHGAAATYLAAIGEVKSPVGIETAATIQPVEMQHAAILGFLLGRYPVPDSFSKTDGARTTSDRIG